MSDPISAEHAARLMASAGERLAEHLYLAETEPGTWYLLFNGGGAYRVEWSAAWGRLVLTAGLGHPPAETQRQSLNLALTYNALWREVGNLRMARDGEGGELMLIGELDPEELDESALDSALVHFEGLRRRWSDALLKAGGSGSDARTVTPPERWVDHA